jgi:hypothetical protein
VQDPDPRRRQLGAQAPAQRHRGSERARFVLGDRRADHEGLGATGQRLRERLVGRRPRLRTPAHLRAHRLAAGRQGVQGDQVEITVEGQGEAARDGGCGEHEQVRHHAASRANFPVIFVASQASQARPLAHAEAMLLVHDGQSQTGEPQAVFEERVRAHDEIELARRGPGEHPLLLGGRQSRVEQPDGEPALCRPRPEGAVVLLGQDRRRRHAQGLAPGPGACQAGRKGDRSLATADIALQQALHGPLPRHGLADPPGCVLLRDGEREGQHGRRRPQDLAGVRRAGQPWLLPHPRPLARQRHLQDEELLEGEPPLCGRGACPQGRDVGVGQIGGRAVDQGKRGCHCGQAEPHAQ